MSDRAIAPLDASPFRKPAVKANAGDLARLGWLPLSLLNVDSTYQRQIVGRGRAQVERIARDFHWRHFTPVVVASDKGVYLVIDGQHRATAALLAGFSEVPCLIVEADAREQARAFAAINGSVTRMSALAVFNAARAAADPDAMALDTVARRGGVRMLGYPVMAANMQQGDCISPARMASLLRKFGDDVMLKAFTALAKSGQTDIRGLVNPLMMFGLCILFSRLAMPLATIPAVFARVNLRKLHDLECINDRDGATLAQRIRNELERLASQPKRLA